MNRFVMQEGETARVRVRLFRDWEWMFVAKSRQALVLQSRGDSFLTSTEVERAVEYAKEHLNANGGGVYEVIIVEVIDGR